MTEKTQTRICWAVLLPVFMYFGAHMLAYHIHKKQTVMERGRE